MNWVELGKESTKISIKFTRQVLTCQLGLLLFNILGILWNCYWYSKSPSSLFSGIGLGAFISNSLWTMGYCVTYWMEIREHKRRLNYYDDFELKQNIQKDQIEYKKAREFYETAYANIMQEHLKNNPEKKFDIKYCSDNSQSMNFKPSIV